MKAETKNQRLPQRATEYVPRRHEATKKTQNILLDKRNTLQL